MVKVRYILIVLIIFVSSCATTTGENIQKASAHYKIGKSYLYENNIQSAYVEFQKALEFNPNDKEALNALGLVHLKFEDFQKAKETFIKATAIDPNFSEAHNNLGITYIKIGKWSDAVNSFKAALKNTLYQTPEHAYYNLGYACYRLGRINDAINAYKEVIKRMQDSHLPYYGLALCYNAEGRYGDAAGAITRALELDPLYKGDKDKALKDFENKKLIAQGEEERDIIDYLEILKY